MLEFFMNFFGGNGGGNDASAEDKEVCLKYATDAALLLRLPKFMLSKMAAELL